MLVCNSCHRHYRPQDGSCPFCGTTLHTTTAAQGLGMTAALVLGLSMFGCNRGDDEGDEADSTESTEGTEGTEGTDSGSTTTDTTATADSDYGGPDTFDTETSFDTGTESTDTTEDTGTADYGGPDTGTDTTDGTGGTGDTADTGTADYGGAPVPDPDFDI